MEEKERKAAPAVEKAKAVVVNGGPVVEDPSSGGSGGVVGGPAGTTKKAGGGFAGLARMLGSKAKGLDGADVDSKRQKGCEDDLPLGMEADSLERGQSSQQRLDSDKLDAFERQGVMGWQSFSSDLSNHTSASSASLELLLNERQVDPEEMLASLGFGHETEGYMPSLARIPERFLRQPSRAAGIHLRGLSEDAAPDAIEEAPQATLAGPTTAESAPIPVPAAARKRPGMSALARTLSLLRMKTSLSRTGHMSPSRTPPLAHQPLSILLPVNQKYLASKGYYRQQGWPRGTFEEADEESQKENRQTKDAATKRKHFQRMKTNRHWSLCDSGEPDNMCEENEWHSQSMDDSLSLDETNERSGSLGTCFSTNTESSTDSLDTPNIETERAFEEIRRQYNESLTRKKSSTDDLFLPCRPRDRLTSDGREDHLDTLNTNDIRSNNYFISPASSRQATVEKAPTISEHSRNSTSDDVDETRPGKKDGNNNKSLAPGNSRYNDGGPDVRIVVSSSDNLSGEHSPSFLVYDNLHAKPSGRLSVKAVQRTSSDSGSTSSSGTAIGSSSIATATDDLDTLMYAESDRETLSGSTSPYSFGHKLTNSVATSGCQTSESDFRLAAAAADSGPGFTAVKKITDRVLGARHSTTQIKASRSRAGGAFTLLLEESPRVQLSPLPTSINPLELMKKLQHSQDELSRMGSVQSDSSGFGDFDPAADAGNADVDHAKLSSKNSGVNSAMRLGKEEIATQTSVDTHGTTSESRSHREIERSSIFDPLTTRYVTMCYIPSLGSKGSASQGDMKHRAVRSDHNLYLSSKLLDAGRHDRLGYYRPRGLSDAGHHLDHVDRSHGRGGESVSDPPRTSSFQFIPRNKTYDLSGPMNRNEGRRGEGESSPMVQRKFTSNLDLYTDEAGLHTKSSGVSVSQRRHSDNNVLNDTPISIELAQATGAAGGSFGSRAFAMSPGQDAPLAGNLTRSGPAGINYPQSHFRPIKRNFSQQRSCDILEDDFSIGDGDWNSRRMWMGGQHQERSDPEDYHRRLTSPHTNYAYSLPPLSMSRTSDDFETYSSVAESSSDYSVQSYPEVLARSDILDSRRLAQLINQPSFYKGKRRANGQYGQYGHYRPRRLFKEWNMLSKRKRLQEENRLLQYTLQKYKTELSIMETSFMIDYQTVYPDMNQDEREELEELEYLWAEVRDQVLEMEHLLLARVKSVHAGNDFHSLMSSMGIINRMIELIKEQMYLQQVGDSRSKEIREEDIGEEDPEASLYDAQYMDSRRSSRLFSADPGKSGPAARKAQSSSLSSIPSDLNQSLEQIKSSLLSQVQLEIKESTKKLELDLQEKDKEIKELRAKLTRSPETPAQPARKWTPRSARTRSFRGSPTPAQGFRSLTSTPASASASRKRSRLMGDKVVQETDV